MNKLFLILGFILISMTFVSAESVQDSIQRQISENPLNYITNSQNNPVPIDVIINAVENNPEFRAKIIKSLIFIFLIMSLTILDLILKGFAMWKASKNNSKIGFWILLLVSSLGILPLCYLIFSKKNKEDKKHEHKK